MQLSREKATSKAIPGLLILAMSLGGALGLSSTPFEGTDGDLQSTPEGMDWDVFAAAGAVKVGVDKPSGQEDDSFRGKEDDAVPDVVFGSIPSNKSDLDRFYVVHDHREEAGQENDLLYLSWFRRNTLGSANMDFEFSQSQRLSANGVTPERTEGDVLVMFGFSGGGSQAALSLSRWTESGACEAASAPPCWGPVVALSGIGEGAVNEVAVTDPVSGQLVEPFTFGEAVLDMTAAGIFAADSCTSFGSVYVKSRSSDSFTASMKDFIQPIRVAVSNCATVTIRKDAVPDSEQSFSFHADAPLSPSTFLLEDDGDDADGKVDQMTLTDREGGTFRIREETQAGWDLTAIECQGQATPERGGDGRLTGAVEIQAAVGENVDCLFTNTRRGRILVDQVALPAGSTQAFPYTLGGAGIASQSFALADGDGLHDSGLLQPGTYSVSPGAVPAGWDLTAAVCSDGSSPDGVVLDAGETVTCTFTHTQRGAMVLDVVTQPGGDPQAFDCRLSGGPQGIDESFSLADLDPAHVVTGLAPGSGYVLEDVIPEGWFGGPAVCDDGSAPADVNIDPGETVSCVLTLTKKGRIRVDKLTQPEGEERLFDFSLSGGSLADANTFQLADATPLHDSGWLMPGSVYTLEEIVVLGKFARPEWDISNLACESESGASPFAFEGADSDAAFQPGDSQALIQLAAGDTVTCAFTNTRRGGITVVKDAIPDAAQDFHFTFTGEQVQDAFDLDDDGDETDDARKGLLPSRRDVTDLLSGSYTISQSDPGADWDASSIVCRDDSGGLVGESDRVARTAVVFLPPGQHITCVFTDTRRGLIVVEKIVADQAVPGAAYDPHQVPFTFSATFAGDFTLSHGESMDSGLLPAGGRHQVSEQKPSGWEVSSVCVYPDGSTGSAGSITVPAGDVVVCTFINEMRLHPGSSGFWRNWRNHYDEDLFRRLMAEAFAGSPVYVDMFTESGDLAADAISMYDDIYDYGGIIDDQKLTAELTSLKLNLAVSSSETPEIRAMQNNNDICAECLLDLDDVPGAEELLLALTGSISVGGLTVGDLIAAAESVWVGELAAGVHLYDLAGVNEVILMTSLLEGTNQGRTLFADPASYPDNPTCLKQPGLPDGTESMFYEAALPLSGGQAPYQCALTAGDLPPGLFLDQQTCSLSGTPQAVGYVSQSFTFQVQVVDGSGSTAQATLSITIHPHPWITTISVPDAVMEMPYTTQLNSTGGTEPTSWVLVDGSLPAGLALDNGNGRISGTPAALKPAKTSLSTFTVRLSDGMGAVDFATFTMSVFPAMDEACDPGLTAPASLLSLGAAPAGAHLQLTWTAAGDASTYDVVGGRLSALRLTGGDFSVATDACVASDHSDTSVLVAGTPAIGDAFWFLVRSGNCQGDGSWDAGGDAQPVSRDESLAQSVNSCQ